MRQVRVVDTTEGIRIDLVDDADFSMFQLGTTVLTSEAAELVTALAGSGRSAIGRPHDPRPYATRSRGRAAAWRTTGRSRPAAPKRRARR